MKILVGSTNPTKVNAVEEAFSRFFDGIDVLGMAAPSGVADQPVGDETYTGARNRAEWLAEQNRARGLRATYCVGIEGGIERRYDRWFGFGVMVILDSQGRMGIGISPQFELPGPVTARLDAGLELGHVMDEMLETQHTNRKGGAIGHFSRGVLSRQDITAHGVIMALVPFLNPEVFFPSGGDGA